jgi:hypothetical protein
MSILVIYTCPECNSQHEHEAQKVAHDPENVQCKDCDATAEYTRISRLVPK